MLVEIVRRLRSAFCRRSRRLSDVAPFQYDAAVRGGILGRRIVGVLLGIAMDHEAIAPERIGACRRRQPHGDRPGDRMRERCPDQPSASRNRPDVIGALIGRVVVARSAAGISGADNSAGLVGERARRLGIGPRHWSGQVPYQRPTIMAPIPRPYQLMLPPADSRSESPPAWMGAAAPTYDVNGKLTMPGRVGRKGVLFCAVFYTVVGGLAWLVIRLL